MAYLPLNQANADPTTATSHNLTSGAPPSPRIAELPITPLSLALDDFAQEYSDRDGGSPGENVQSKVSKLLSSLTSSSRHSYDLAEDDDYEMMDQETPTLERHPKNYDTSTMDAQFSQRISHDTPARTASISRQLPLNHPVPDLQSIQGAYVKNVERLEESAARLSMESNLEEEIQRIRYGEGQSPRIAQKSSPANSARLGHLRQVSARSMVSAIVDPNSVASSGGYPPSVKTISPVGSIKSPTSSQNTANNKRSKPSRLPHPLPEPEMEGRPLDSDVTISQLQGIMDAEPRLPLAPSSISPSNVSLHERPTTSGSGDTYQQARTLFTDFDGVHYAPEKGGRERRRISLTRPPRARDSRAFKEPQPGEEMIYYPAPVPVMLNLPVRLSKMNWSDQEKRRLKALSGIPNEMRKSAAWLAKEDDIPAASQRKSIMLPPQLRASAFFDHRGTTSDVHLKDGSAVATLDDILDAAAHAPVSAFTDHPIAGHLGDDFYGAEQKSPRKSAHMVNGKKAKRKSSISNLLKRNSSNELLQPTKPESRAPSMLLSRRDGHGLVEDDIDDTAMGSIAPGSDEGSGHEHDDHDDREIGPDGESDSDESQFRPGFSAAPTTLLAELQMRKAQQRSRNRNAADAFPNGVHSTLLELDTVAQLQQKARRQKHVTLAWEDKDVVEKENYDDEDVPLGVLFPEKEQQSHVNLNRPLGLMEKRELEENEPLSQRRARLRGEPLPAPSKSPAISHQDEGPGRPRLDLPDLNTLEGDGNEEETLAQRRQRMKDRKENGASADFAQTLNSELGLRVEDLASNNLAKGSSSKTPDPEETLGQRRKRLQAEALNGGNVGEQSQDRPALKTRPSLADVLRANPIGYVDHDQAKTTLLSMQTHERAKEREAQYLAAQEAARKQAYLSENTFGLGNQSGLIQTPFGTYQGYQQPYPTTSLPYMPNGNVMNVIPPTYGYSNGTNVNTYPTQMTPNAGAENIYMNHPHQRPMAQGYAYPSVMDLNGMGPPLDSKQRARIEGWRQGIM